jgi:polyisoprenoid-binding protein YceI
MTFAVPPGSYALDPARCTVTLTSRHIGGVAPVRGTLAVESGTVSVAPDVGESRAHVRLDATAFDTGSALRDRVLRSGLYLAIGKHPTMDVQLTGLAVTDAGLTGTVELTVRGVPARVEIRIDDLSASEQTVTARVTGRVDRHAHGVSAARGVIQGMVEVEVAVVAVALPAAVPEG